MTYAIAAPGWEALGWTLIHFCWQATAIALLYWFADVALSKAQSQARYVLALGAMLSMLAVAGTTLVYETTKNAQDRISQAEWQNRPEVGALRDSAALVVTGQHAAASADPGAPLLAAVHNAIQYEMRGAMPWLDVMYLFGVLCLSVRTVGGWWLIQRLRRTSMARVPAHVSASLARLVKRIGLRRPVDLRISTRVSSPLAMGVLRSVILLPASALTSLSPEQLEVVLAHELAHIRRADYLWNMLQTMIETLFFFHPAVWWVGRNLRRHRELCCDDAALECCTDPLTYATALLRLEEERSSRLRLAMALDGHESGGLRVRIARILGEAPSSGRDVAPFSLLGVCAMLGIVLLSAPRLFADLYTAEVSTQDQANPPALASTAPLPHASKIAADPSRVSVSTGRGAASGSGRGIAGNYAAAQNSKMLPSPPAIPAQVQVATPTPAPAPAARVVLAPAPAAVPMPDPEIIALAPMARDSMREMKLMISPSAQSATVVHVTELQRMAPRALMALHVAPSVQVSADSDTPKSDYIDQMRAAGYNVDLDKYVAMKIQGVTPEYARSMAATGFGKPTADELIAMKIHSVNPAEVAELKAAGIEATSYQDLITYRIFRVTPDYVAGMKAAGFSNLPAKKVVELRIQNVTPEFAKTTKQQWPDATVDQLVQLRIFNINGAFIASAKQHGLEPLTIDKLVRLRISGILDDETPGKQKDKDKDKVK